MEYIEITQDTFASLYRKAQLDYLNNIRKRFGNENIMVQIGNVVLRDREELQAWQIEKGIL